MFCNFCGAVVPNNVPHCENCGGSLPPALSGLSPVQPAVAPQQPVIITQGRSGCSWIMIIAGGILVGVLLLSFG
jgi:hypothetical protein